LIGAEQPQQVFQGEQQGEAQLQRLKQLAVAPQQPRIALQHHQHHAEHDGDQQAQVEVAACGRVGLEDDARQPVPAHGAANRQGHRQHPCQLQGNGQLGHGPGA
jgi:hypothetical protein